MTVEKGSEVDRAKALLRELQEDEAERIERIGALMARLHTDYFDTPGVVEAVADQLLDDIEPYL